MMAVNSYEAHVVGWWLVSASFVISVFLEEIWPVLAIKFIVEPFHYLWHKFICFALNTWLILMYWSAGCKSVFIDHIN